MKALVKAIGFGLVKATPYTISKPSYMNRYSNCSLVVPLAIREFAKKAKNVKKEREEKIKTTAREEFQGNDDDKIMEEAKTLMDGYQAGFQEMLEQIKLQQTDLSNFDNIKISLHKNVVLLSEIANISKRSYNQVYICVYDQNIIEIVAKALEQSVPELSCEIQGKGILATTNKSIIDHKSGAKTQVKTQIDKTIKEIKDQRRLLLSKCKRLGSIISKDIEKNLTKQIDTLIQNTINSIEKKGKAKLDQISEH